MGAFTQEQQEILTGLGLSYVGAVHEVVSMLTVRIAAIKSLIVAKGLAAEEEVDAAIQEIEAAGAVTVTLSPAIAVLEEQIRRRLGGSTPSAPTE